MSDTEWALAYANENRARFVGELQEFVRFPSVSARPEHRRDSAECAGWLADHLRRIGLERVAVVQTRGNPIVYAEWLHAPDRPTVIIYGHYDVQPVDPLDQWHSSPFSAQVRGDYLYGRGASDDKGQMFAHLKAIECCLRALGRLPVNVKCLFEGEEEIGSSNFAPFLIEHRSELQADVVFASDSAMPGPHQPAITYAMRGALMMELEVTGPESDLHDGVFGGMVHNPLKGLCDIVSGLQTKTGEITIPGFYDRVSETSREERSFMASNGPTGEQLLKDARTRTLWGERSFTPYERATIRPSLTITGITGGYQGTGPKSIIPARAVAKLSFRLVPRQDPLEIEQLVRKYIARLTPFGLQSKMTTHMTSKPVFVDRQHGFIKTAAVACGAGFGRAPVFIRSGGTIPALAAFQNVLNILIAMIGFGLPDDRIHAPNERFHLPNLFKGITTSILFLEGMSHDY
jgi:acetylornithine deacetylase/succinyl-diaminopimelate desuccinylase-like protein